MTGRTPAAPLAWLGGLLALYLCVPVVAFGVRISRSGDRGFGVDGLTRALATSVETATISTVIIAICGVPLAHWLARSSGRIASIAGVLVQLPLALPPVMSGVILVYVVGPYTAVGRFFGGQLTDSMAGVVLAQTFVAAPFAVIAARSAFASVEPGLEDRAATLGHRPLDRFFRVALPIAASGIRAGLLLTWLRALGEYGATVLLAYHPYTLPVYTYVQFSGSGIPTTQAPTALALAVAVLAVAVSRLRWPARFQRPLDMPDPRPPARVMPTVVAFELDVEVGDFRLALAHRASSQRIAILGPSGSGKSMTLRSLAGLLGDVGAVYYGGRRVDGVPTESRGIGYVPQGLGLFPGRTVWRQVCFATNADQAVAAWWLRALHIEELAGRRPDELSGGQRQRVSLAQALAHGPRLVLLDEPFSALDAPVRDELRQELRRLQREAGLSTVLVTHDPEEAALLADEILVIDHGRLLQSGPRAEVYRRPASPQVARLLGVHNLNAGVVVSPTAVISAGQRIDTAEHGLADGTAVLWCIRPDRVVVGEGPYSAMVADVADVGTMTALIVRVGDIELRARTTDEVSMAVGQAGRVRLDPEHITVWPADRALIGD